MYGLKYFYEERRELIRKVNLLQSQLRVEGESDRNEFTTNEKVPNRFEQNQESDIKSQQITQQHPTITTATPTTEQITPTSNTEEHLPDTKEQLDETTDEFRRNSVRNAFLHAWTGYKTYAWGHDEVRPLTNDVSCDDIMMSLILFSSQETTLEILLQQLLIV